MTAWRALAGLVVALVAVPVALVAVPGPIAPEAWTPVPAVPLVGVWAPNRALAEAVVWPSDGRPGPEDVAVLPDGSVVAGALDGTLLRWTADGSGPRVWADTGGRPLGLDVASDGRLVVADAERGVLVVDGDGVVTVLCDTVAGRRLGFADDLEVGPDGVVWVSDVTSRHPFHAWELDLIENQGTGRLVSVDLATGEARERLGGLHFANGVAVAHDGSFVLVAETARYRVRRLWVTGPRAGQDEVWVDGLPGFPDGISRGEDGLFWLALPSPRNAALDATAGLPWARRAIVRLPAWLQPAPTRHARVVGLDADGRVVRVLDDPEGVRFATITSVQQHGDVLWLGSLAEAGIAHVRLPAAGR